MIHVTKQLIVLCGLPFAGKTTYLQTINRPFFLVSRDDILTEMVGNHFLMAELKNQASQITDPVSKQFSTVQENALNDLITLEYIHRVEEIIHASIEGTVVVDGTHLQPLSRLFVRAFPEWTRTAIIMDTPLAICVERLEQAGLKGELSGLRATLTKEKIRTLSDVKVWPTKEEGFDMVQTIFYA